MSRRARILPLAAGSAALGLVLSGCGDIPQPTRPELTPYERPAVGQGEAAEFLTTYAQELDAALGDGPEAVEQLQTGPLLERTVPAVRAAAEKRAFVLHGIYLVAGFAAVFAGAYPNVLPSSLDPANSLTIASASSSDYTLTVMLIVTVVILPVIIAYQTFSYRMFLDRIAETHIPEAHRVPVAIHS